MCNQCTQLNRRRFFGLAASGVAAAGMLGMSSRFSPAEAATSLTPDEALAKLKAGNAKYVAASDIIEAEMPKQRASVAKAQQPWATILGCVDSRTAPELIFGGTNLGELFVARNGGNMADQYTLGAIEYGVEHLGSPLIVVVGHSRCGAVVAACDVVSKNAKLSGPIKSMVDPIVPAAKAVFGKPGDFVDNAVRENAKRTAARMLKTSKIIAEHVHHGKLKVVPAYYSLDTGAIEFLA